MIIKALKKTFAYKKSWLVFAVAIFLVFMMLVMIPVATTPGNDFLFQLHVLKWYGVALVIFLSISNGLLITMQIEIRKQTKQAHSLKHKAAETTTVFGLIVGALVSTIACAACYSSVLALFGLGATAFLVEHRLWISLITILITLYALYYSTKRLNNECATCRIDALADSL